MEHITMRRRWSGLLALAAAACLGGTTFGPAMGADRPARQVRVGMLALNKAEPVYRPSQGVIAALQERGWIDGKTMHIEARHADDDPARLPALARELVQQRVDVIVAYTNAAAFAAKAATREIPIVFWASHGAVDTGLVASLARPGGNLTGVESLAPELDAKRLQLLREMLPKVEQVGVLHNALDAGAAVHLASVAQGARVLGMRTTELPVRGPADLGPTLASAPARAGKALLTLTDDLIAYAWESGEVNRFALDQRIPTVCEFEFLVQMGCLLSYGPRFEEFHQRVASQVDRILKGTKPKDLPVEQPTRFELGINLQTARALGITVPDSLRLRADKLFE